MFDWPTFLQRYNIEHVTEGRPARRDWLAVICPWCGQASQHYLGINTKLGIYHCWHGASHVGRSPARLVAALLGCSFQEAVTIVGSTDVTFARSDDTFADDALRRLGMAVSGPKLTGGRLEPLPEFVPIKDAGLGRVLVFPYLEKRGYNHDDVVELAARYQLMFAPKGQFAYRIIIPVIADGKLVTWTGRSVAKSEELRYKSLSSDPERAERQGLPVAAANIKDTLLDMDTLSRGGDVLVITEGPFDAFRIGMLGERYGVRATCLFSKEASPRQIDLLAGLADAYDEIVALLDRDADFDTFMTMPDYLKIKQLRLPRGVKDPAELSKRQFMDVLNI